MLDIISQNTIWVTQVNYTFQNQNEILSYRGWTFLIDITDQKVERWKKFYDMYLITIIKPEQLHETADAFERSIL